MSDRTHIGPDNEVLRSRLRQPMTPIASQDTLPAQTSPIRRVISDVSPSSRVSASASAQQIKPRASFIHAEPVIESPKPDVSKPENAAPLSIVRPQPFAVPAQNKQQPSQVLRRQIERPKVSKRRGLKPYLNSLKQAKLQTALVGMAVCVFVVGAVVSLQTVKTNHAATAQVAALTKRASSGTNSSDTPSEEKPSEAAVRNYVVAADMARYIKIPKLDVNARVLQVGITKSGALDTPNNIYDAAWYSGSAKPGQPGATLIDGHVSGWTSHGVFYGIKNLAAGDAIQIERGDGKTLNYKVVKVQIYDAGNVDMQAAVNPVTPGSSGLNLITCDGQVKAGTSQYNKRVVVFAELTN